ncbi:MAG TPA: LPS export ABC transporter permease LptG [Rhodobiaceae bacterium]|nr:LPS export ABC transporter permease LptG [Rhodobiaceae bacterium]|tara:strand:- start:7837 stop:8934 length:1098 start_codon:yes stop_codon:yes gene_type:complete
MTLNTRLKKYLGQQFLIWIGGAFIFTTFISLIFDMSEVAQTNSNKEAFHFFNIALISLMRLPNLMNEILPFIFLFGTIGFFAKMRNSNELIIARASGISVWQFLAPGLLATLLIGCFFMMLWQPISSYLYMQSEQFKESKFYEKSNQLSISKNGLWLRENTKDGFYILHAESVSETDPIQIGNPVIMQFDSQNQLVSRITAKSGILGFQNWHLKYATLQNAVLETSEKENIYIPTKFKTDQIVDNFQAPTSISFWDLNDFIDVSETSGLPVNKYEMYFHLLMARPLLMVAMVLIAATFGLKHARSGGHISGVVFSIIFGFLLFIFAEFMKTLGELAMLSPPLAAWTPGVIASLIGITLLLHREDG